MSWYLIFLVSIHFALVLYTITPIIVIIEKLGITSVLYDPPKKSEYEQDRSSDAFFSEFWIEIVEGSWPFLLGIGCIFFFGGLFATFGMTETTRIQELLPQTMMDKKYYDNLTNTILKDSFKVESTFFFGLKPEGFEGSKLPDLLPNPVFSDDFDFFDNKTQTELKDFCKDLREQPFVLHVDCWVDRFEGFLDSLSLLSSVDENGTSTSWYELYDEAENKTLKYPPDLALDKMSK